MTITKRKDEGLSITTSDEQVWVNCDAEEKGCIFGCAP